MGLKTLAQTLASKAMLIAGDIPVDVVFTHVISSVYNPTLDTMTDTVSTVTVKGVMSKAKVDEDDNKHTQLNDSKLIIPRVDLIGVPVESIDNCTINSQVYTIVKRVTDPADAIYILTIRV